MRLCGLALALVFLALLGAEVALRGAGHPARLNDTDAATGLPLTAPGQNFLYRKPCFKNSVTINSEGFHDREFRTAKPPDTFRIAILGDDAVRALEVPLDKTFHKILADKLNASAPTGRRYEVYAFGMNAGGTALSALLLKHLVAPYRPDLVIHAFSPLNDVREDSEELTELWIEQTGDKSAREGLVFPRFDKRYEIRAEDLETDLARLKNDRAQAPLFTRFLRHFALTAWVGEKINAWQRRYFSKTPKRELPEPIPPVPVDLQVLLKTYPNAWALAWVREDHLIKILADEARGLGAKYLLLAMPDGYRAEARYERDAFWTPENLDALRPETMLSKIAARHKLAHFAALPAVIESLKSTVNSPITYECDPHLNPLGHVLLADALYDYLTAHPVLLGL